jgi:NTP pyrophosphatase (non-canonical NTP hydrolase)
MDIKDYQLFTRTVAVYPGAGEQGFPEINYLVLGLTSEAGEVAGKLKKVIRGDNVAPESFLSEVSDVLWYLARIADNLGLTLEDIADYNVAKLTKRKELDTIKGEGDQREGQLITSNA